MTNFAPRSNMLKQMEYEKTALDAIDGVAHDADGPIPIAGMVARQW